MQCIKCGREIPDGELFCEACASGPAKPKELEKAASAATPRAKKAVRRGGHLSPTSPGRGDSGTNSPALL